jgi:pimeloyl-ACP methyl ester carboxylesterase
VNEEAVRFGPQRGLVGIVTTPDEPRPAELPAVVLLNAGLMHRVGPNRTYVQIARALAAQGFTVLRFDFSGMGDSRPRADHLPYMQSAPQEAGEAMSWLAEHHAARRFILIGHCAGAGVALLVARDDQRVVGAALINMEGGDAGWTEYDRIKKVSQQHARTYGQRALFSRERWAKLLSGRADYASIARVVFKDILWYRIVSLQFRVSQALQSRQATARAQQVATAETYLDPIIRRGCALLLLHSEGSTGLEQIRAVLGPELERRLAAGTVQLTVIAQSDHLFTLLARQRQLCAELLAWAGDHFEAPSTTLVGASSDR